MKYEHIIADYNNLYESKKENDKIILIFQSEITMHALVFISVSLLNSDQFPYCFSCCFASAFPYQFPYCARSPFLATVLRNFAHDFPYQCADSFPHRFPHSVLISFLTPFRAILVIPFLIRFLI